MATPNKATLRSDISEVLEQYRRLVSREVQLTRLHALFEKGLSIVDIQCHEVLQANSPTNTTAAIKLPPMKYGDTYLHEGSILIEE